MDVETELLNVTLCDNFSDVAVWPFECISLGLRVFHAISMVLILVAAMMGNGTLLTLVASNRKLHTPTISASLGLVVADLLVAVVWVFQALTSTIPGKWLFGDVGCNILAYLYTTLLYVRWCEVLAFTLDRMLHIVSPFFYNRHAKLLVTTFTMIAWIFPAVVNLPTAVLGNTSFYLTLTSCSIDCGTNSPCRNGLVSTFGFFITIGAIVPTALYFIIFLYGRKKKQEMDRMLQMGSISGKKMVGDTQVRSTWYSIAPQAKKALISCFIVFLIILFTNIPVYVTSSLRGRPQIYSKIPFLVHFIVVYIFLAGPILDPIIIMRNRDFWEVIYRIRRNRRARKFPVGVVNILALTVVSPEFLKSCDNQAKYSTSTQKYVLKVDSKASESESFPDTDSTFV